MTSDKTKKVDEVESVEEVKQEPEKTKEQKRSEELENHLKRSLADYQNLEKRIGEERRSWVQQANKGLLLRLLPALDTLELALKHSQDKGVSMAIAQLMDALKKEGIEKIKTENIAFDPYRMECVQTIEGKENMVLQEIRSGYTLYDKVLRPAQVVVGKGK